MTMKEWLDREIANVRANKQNALNIFQQASGAEQALLATLKQIEFEEAEQAVPEETQEPNE